MFCRFRKSTNCTLKLNVIDSAITNVSSITHTNSLRYQSKMKTTDRTPFIITHNPGNAPLAVLYSSSRMRKAVPSPPIVGERNCNNLRKMLMPSKPPKQKPREPEKNKETEGSFKCTKKCIICKEHLEQTTIFSSVKTKKTFFIRDHLICSSSNIVYLTDCAKCGSVQYMGETGNFGDRKFPAEPRHQNQQKHFSGKAERKRE